MSDLMVGRPIKFRVLEILSDGAEEWNYDLVKQIMDEYGLKSNFQKYSINFDLIEIQASGFITPVESKIDEVGTFRVGSLLNKYKIVSPGKKQYDELATKVKKET